MLMEKQPFEAIAIVYFFKKKCYRKYLYFVQHPENIQN